MKNRSVFVRLLQELSKYRVTMLATLLFAAAGSVASVLSTLYIGKAIDVVAGRGNVDFPALYRILAVLVVLYLVAALFTWLVSLMANRVAYRTARDLRIKAFQKLNRLPLSFFDGSSHGDIISRFTNDLDNVSDALSLGIVNLFSGAVLVLSCLVLMLLLSIPITLVILLATPLCFVVAYFVAKASQKTFARQQKIVGEISGFVSEIVGNQKTVKAFGYEQQSFRRFTKLNDSLYHAGKNAQFASSMVNPSTRVVDHISYMLVGIVGGFAAIAGGVSVGTISSFLIYAGQFSKPFNEVSGIMANLQTAVASLKRVFAILDQPEELADSSTAQGLERAEGLVEFDNVCFSYDKTRPLIEDFTLQVKPGSLVAIVGPTGAGKTTIVNLLMRFYELNGGKIRLDGQDITHLTRDSLRRGFGMVLQETWLFSGTVRDNIAYGKPDATDDEIIAAAKFAHAHSFIRQMPGGYGALITEDGGNLSQGQKQLLTIARVMLTNPSMLILDEATSSIDTLTEMRVQRAFMKLMQGRTSFVIAHRLSTISSADIILVLDKGHIIETGTHRELLEKKGFYARLYHSQFES